MQMFIKQWHKFLVLQGLVSETITQILSSKQTKQFSIFYTQKFIVTVLAHLILSFIIYHSIQSTPIFHITKTIYNKQTYSLLRISYPSSIYSISPLSTTLSTIILYNTNYPITSYKIIIFNNKKVHFNYHIHRYFVRNTDHLLLYYTPKISDMSATIKFIWQLFLVNSFFLMVRIFRINIFYLVANFSFFSFLFIVIYAKLVETHKKGKQPEHEFISKRTIHNAVGFVFAPLETVERIVDAGSILQNIVLFILLIVGAYLGTFVSSVTYIVFITNLYLLVTFLKTHSWFQPIYNFFASILNKIFNPHIIITEPIIPFERQE